MNRLLLGFIIGLSILFFGKRKDIRIGVIYL